VHRPVQRGDHGVRPAEEHPPDLRHPFTRGLQDAGEHRQQHIHAGTRPQNGQHSGQCGQRCLPGDVHSGGGTL